MIINKIKVNEGSLEVSEKMDLANSISLGFYWFDARLFPQYNQGFGPFMSLNQAVEHYSTAVTQQRTEKRQAEAIDNVIYVDFVKRQRMAR